MVPPQFFSGPVHPGSTTIGADRLPVPQGFFKIVIDPATGWALGFMVPQAALTKDKAAGETITIETIIAATGIILPPPGDVVCWHTTVANVGRVYRTRGPQWFDQYIEALTDLAKTDVAGTRALTEAQWGRFDRPKTRLAALDRNDTPWPKEGTAGDWLQKRPPFSEGEGRTQSAAICPILMIQLN